MRKSGRGSKVRIPARMRHAVDGVGYRDVDRDALQTRSRGARQRRRRFAVVIRCRAEPRVVVEAQRRRWMHLSRLQPRLRSDST